MISSVTATGAFLVKEVGILMISSTLYSLPVIALIGDLSLSNLRLPVSLLFYPCESIPS